MAINIMYEYVNDNEKAVEEVSNALENIFCNSADFKNGSITMEQSATGMVSLYVNLDTLVEPLPDFLYDPREFRLFCAEKTDVTDATVNIMYEYANDNENKVERVANTLKNIFRDTANFKNGSITIEQSTTDIVSLYVNMDTLAEPLPIILYDPREFRLFCAAVDNAIEYNRIDKVVLRGKDDGIIFDNCFFLTGDIVDKELEIDMTGDWCFNEVSELEVISRETVATVNSVKEIIDFAKNNSEITYIYCNRENDPYEIFVGGGHDCILSDHSLSNGKGIVMEDVSEELYKGEIKEPVCIEFNKQAEYDDI